MHVHEHHAGHLVTDPVCGMKLDPVGAVSVDHGGATYWFCEQACAETFRGDPDRWTTSAPLSHDHAGDSTQHHCA